MSFGDNGHPDGIVEIAFAIMGFGEKDIDFQVAAKCAVCPFDFACRETRHGPISTSHNRRRFRGQLEVKRGPGPVRTDSFPISRSFQMMAVRELHLPPAPIYRGFGNYLS
jgi:hypothetical protein